MAQASRTTTTDRPPARMRVWPALGARSFLGVVLAVVLAACGATLLLPHDPYVRYQSFGGTIFSRLSWVYERIAFDSRPIDVLVIGSSRTARGANVEMLERDLAAQGADLHVANVSIPASGFDWRLTVLREALRHHPEIRMVIWELVEVFPRDGHQAFADLGTTGELLSSPWIVNRNLPENLARLPYRQMEFYLASRLPEAFGMRAAFDPGRYLGPAPDHRGFAAPDWWHTDGAVDLRGPAHARALAAESAQRLHEITWPVLPGALGWAEFGVSRHYVREAAALAEEHGIEIAFLFLPFYQGPENALEAEWVQQFGPYWGASWMRTDAANYQDAAHGSQIGIERIAPWLAGRIAADLGGGS